MQFTRTMKMADVIHRNYMVLQILPRFGINLGFGDKTIEEVCRDQGIHLNFFLDMLNSYLDKAYFPKKHLQGFSVLLIIEYLKKAHEDYLNTKLPRLEEFILLVTGEKHQKNTDYAKLLKDFFNNYKKEFIHHIKREEEHVYPYILKIEESFRLRKPGPEIVNAIRNYSIVDYANEHDNIEDKLFDLKNIIIKYLPSPVNNLACNELLIELFSLERDLNDHARIEDKIMVPKVQNMEKWLLDSYKL
jgi:regulator of cell morphogenesis and NO signaling